MAEWVWVQERVARDLHDDQLVEHGGPQGLRDLGLLQSALARAENLAAYGDPDAAALAAAYAFGIARNHPFIDGNKRTAAVVSLVFLEINDYAFEITNPELAAMIQQLAAGELAEDAVAAWFRERIV